MTPSFSFSKSSTSNRWNMDHADLISASCPAEMSFSLASLDLRGVAVLLGVEAASLAFFFGG
jgi:hypothetical protein